MKGLIKLREKTASLAIHLKVMTSRLTFVRFLFSEKYVANIDICKEAKAKDKTFIMIS